MPRAQLASGHFERDVAGESERILVNMYLEDNPGDPLRPVRLVTTPGSVDRDTGNTITGNIRAMGQSDSFAGGLILILDGTTLRTWNLANGTFGTITGTVSGTDRAQIEFTQTECAVLSDGTLYVSSNGTSIAAASDPDFPTGITSIASLNHRILMTAADGKFWYTETLDVDNIVGTNFYTAEGAPDNLVAVVVLGTIAYMCGNTTIEPWYDDAASTTDPFSRSSTIIPHGVKCRDGIEVIKEAGMIVCVDNNNVVLQIMGVQAQAISTPAISRLLKDTDADDVIATSYVDEGHAFYCLNTPTRCEVYDFGKFAGWHQRITNAGSTWDFVDILQQSGRTLAAKRTGSTFVELSRDYATDEQADESTLGTDIPREWSVHIPIDGGRPVLGAIHLEGSKGRGNAAGDGNDPVIGLRISKDNGNTWSNRRTRKIGAQGAYDERTKWERNGRGKRPQTVLWFDTDEPVKFDITGCVYGQRS
jgi:hypothetical protein